MVRISKRITGLILATVTVFYSSALGYAIASSNIPVSINDAVNYEISQYDEKDYSAEGWLKCPANTANLRIVGDQSICLELTT